MEGGRRWRSRRRDGNDVGVATMSSGGLPEAGLVVTGGRRAGRDGGDGAREVRGGAGRGGPPRLSRAARDCAGFWCRRGCGRWWCRRGAGRRSSPTGGSPRDGDKSSTRRIRKYFTK